MFQLFIVFLSIISILFIFGFGVTNIILPTKLKNYKVVLIPWVGLGFCGMVSIYFSLIGIAANISSFIVCFLSIVLGVIAIKRKLFKVSDLINKNNLFLFIILLLGFISSSIPLIFSKSPLTAIAAGNNDIVIYSMVSKSLIHNGIYNLDSNIFNFAKLHGRWGTYLMPSIISTLFNLEVYQVIYILFAIINSLLSFTVFFMAQLLFKISKKISLIISFIYVINSNIIYILLNNFFAQILFTGFMIITSAIAFSALSEPDEYISEENKLSLFLAFFTLAAISSYPEGIPYLVLPIIFYALWKLIFSQYKYFIVRLIVKTFLLTIIMNPIVVYVSIKQVIVASSQNVGWDIPILNLYELIGFLNAHVSIFHNLNIFTILLLNFMVFIILVFGFLISNHKGYITVTILLSILVVSWLYIGRHFNYGIFKTFCLNIHTILILFCIGIFNILEIIQNKVKIFSKSKLFLENVIYSGLIMLIIISSLPLTLKMISIVKENKNGVVNEQLAQLELINDNKDITEINLDIGLSAGYWNQLWSMYFLNQKKLNIITESNGYFPQLKVNSPKKGVLFLSENLQDSFLKKCSPLYEKAENIFLKNSLFTLKYSGDVEMFSGKGFWGKEKANNLVYSWVDDVGDITLMNFYSKDEDYVLTGTAWIGPGCSYPTRAVDVYLNNKLVDTIKIVNTIKFISNLHGLEYGKNELKFVAREKVDTVPLLNGDTRRINFALSELSVLTSKDLNIKNDH